MKKLIRHYTSFGILILFILFGLSSEALLTLGVKPFPKDSLPCEYIDPPENRTTTVQVDVINENGIGVGGVTVKVQAGVVRTVIDPSLGGYCLSSGKAQSIEEDLYVTGGNGTVVFNYVTLARNELDKLRLKAETADASYIKNYDYSSVRLGGNGSMVLSAIKKDEL